MEERNPNRNYVDRRQFSRPEPRPLPPPPTRRSETGATDKKQTPQRPTRLSASQQLWLKRWIVLATIALSALCIVFFVNNVLHVGKLTEEIEQLKKEQDKLLHQNEIYRAEIIRLQSPDRITKIARLKLNMVAASSAPQVLLSNTDR